MALARGGRRSRLRRDPEEGTATLTHALRRRIGAALPRACADAARAAGFTRLELMSTLPGVPFYAKLGFTEGRRVTDVLPDGTSIEFVPMTRSVT